MRIFDFFKRKKMAMKGTVNCKEFAEKLFDTIDGEISEAKLKEMVSHMDRCSPCKDAYELEAAIKEAIANRVKKEAPPKELVNEINKKVQDLCS